MNLEETLIKIFKEYSPELPAHKNIDDLILLLQAGRVKAGWSGYLANKYSKLLPGYKLGGKPKVGLLKHFGYKHCNKCVSVYKLRNFSKSASNADGLFAMCKLCAKVYSKKYNKTPEAKALNTASRAKRRAAKILRTPGWAELKSIKDFYMECPKGYQVDHVIPLQGVQVSGLHVLRNLQYLTASENLCKSNKFEPQEIKCQHTTLSVQTVLEK